MSKEGAQEFEGEEDTGEVEGLCMTCTNSLGCMGIWACYVAMY